MIKFPRKKRRTSNQAPENSLSWATLQAGWRAGTQKREALSRDHKLITKLKLRVTLPPLKGRESYLFYEKKSNKGEGIPGFVHRKSRIPAQESKYANPAHVEKKKEEKSSHQIHSLVIQNGVCTKRNDIL
jgi:hypothetical protein